MKLAVGDVVVYGTHGIGRVAARKEQVVLGATREVVVLELADGLTVTLSLERAGEQPRPLAAASCQVVRDSDPQLRRRTQRHRWRSVFEST